jgi:two-component system cell cycle response regulator
VRVMLVEDSVVETQQIGNYLAGWGIEFLPIGDGKVAWGVLQRPDPPNLVLLDWVLPGIDGIELCRRIRTLGATGAYTYVVMLTAKDKKQDLLTAMAAGADDYLVKPVDPEELRARLMVGKRLLELQQSMRFAATHDCLTKLLNRSEILASMKRELSRCQRENRSTAIILADLDHFKRINDSLGHAAGDAVLKEVAERLQSDLRTYDLVGRYGGEEFLILLPNCDSMTATRRADEIRNLVSRKAIITTFATVSATISMGVTVSDKSQSLAIEDLLHQADQAMYAAKEAGRNCVRTFMAVGEASNVSG